MKEKELHKEKEYLLTKGLKEKDISKYKYYKWIKDNDLTQVSRGIYVSANEIVDDLFVISQRCPVAIFSHDEAFYYHGLSEREPLIHTFTVYSGYNVYRLTKDKDKKAYFVKKELLDLGKITVRDNYNNDIPMYDLERTICDLIRNRNSMEIQEFSTLLKAYVSRSDKDLIKLMKYSKKFHIDNVIRRYMEILL